MFSLFTAQELISLREFSDCERELWKQEKENSEAEKESTDLLLVEMKKNVRMILVCIYLLLIKLNSFFSSIK